MVHLSEKMADLSQWPNSTLIFYTPKKYPFLIKL
jgi:hypothetical protein